MTELMQNNKKPDSMNARSIEEYEERLRFVSTSDAMPATSGHFDKSAKARAARSMGAVEETNPVDIDELVVKPKPKKLKSAMKKPKKEEEIVGDEEEPREKKRSKSKKDKKPKSEREDSSQPAEKAKKSKKKKNEKKELESEDGAGIEKALKHEKSKKKKTVKPDDSWISQPVEREIEPGGPTAASACCSIL
jgi:hypothetical protein